jgi:hypothetical protein
MTRGTPRSAAIRMSRSVSSNVRFSCAAAFLQLRHAISATLITTVRDRHAQIGNPVRNDPPCQLHVNDTTTSNQGAGAIDSIYRGSIIVPMERPFLSNALRFGMAATVSFFVGCVSTQSRISNNPEMYQRLSATDQALVSQGQIRRGMSMDEVWLAWGTPEQKIPADVRGGAGETWVYCVTPHLRVTGARTITALLTGPTSRQSSPTLLKGSPFPTAESFTSGTCRPRHLTAGRQFRSHSAGSRISLAARRNG